MEFQLQHQPHHFNRPRFATIPARSSGVFSTIFDKIVGHLTLSPQGPRPRSKPNLVEFTVIKVKRHLPSKSFYESHRRQPSITRYRSNKRKSGMKTLDGQAAQRLHLSLPLNPHWGRIIDREQAVPRLSVSADRPKHNIIGPKLCNKPRAVSVR